jgi:hypothetical protein
MTIYKAEVDWIIREDLSSINIWLWWEIVWAEFYDGDCVWIYRWLRIISYTDFTPPNQNVSM